LNPLLSKALLPHVATHVALCALATRVTGPIRAYRGASNFGAGGEAILLTIGMAFMADAFITADVTADTCSKQIVNWDIAKPLP
jgi:hypothetical protein